MSVPLSTIQARIRQAEARIHDELRELHALAPSADVEVRLEKVPVVRIGHDERFPESILAGVRIQLTL